MGRVLYLCCSPLLAKLGLTELGACWNFTNIKYLVGNEKKKLPIQVHNLVSCDENVKLIGDAHVRNAFYKSFKSVFQSWYQHWYSD